MPRPKKVVDDRTGEVFKSVRDFCNRYGLGYNTVCYKLNNGYSVSDILGGVTASGKSYRIPVYNDEYKMAVKLGVSKSLFEKLKAKGFTLEDIKSCVEQGVKPTISVFKIDGRFYRTRSVFLESLGYPASMGVLMDKGVVPFTVYDLRDAYLQGVKLSKRSFKLNGVWFKNRGDLLSTFKVSWAVARNRGYLDKSNEEVLEDILQNYYKTRRSLPPRYNVNKDN